MTDDPVPPEILQIEKILDDVDGTIRLRLAKLGLAEVDHLILAIGLDGSGILRSTCAPEDLRAMADMLIEIADHVQPDGFQKPN
jgi:hypothetical protein